MLTFKIILDKRHEKKDGSFPIKLRIFQNQNYKECSLNISIQKKEWNSILQMVSSSNSNHKLYNSRLLSIKANVQKYILLQDEHFELTPEVILNRVNGKKIKILKENKPDLLHYGKKHILQLQASGNIGNSIAYSCAINKLEAFVKTEKLPFECVNYTFLENFNSYMLLEGLKINSISLYFRSIRALFNKAIKEGIIDMNGYPFTRFKIKSEKTISRALTVLEMKNIVSLEIPIGSKIWHHRNLFLMSFYLIGINFSDLLTLNKKSFVDGRVIFRRKKTHKIYSIKMSPQIEILFNFYLLTTHSEDEFILPFIINKSNPLVLKKDTLQAIKNTNHYLKQIAKDCLINKNLTTYYARYSWANIAKLIGYSKDMIAEALGHEYGNKVTGIYLDDFDKEVIDEMNKKVIEEIEK